MKLSVGMKIGGGFFIVLLLLSVVAVQSALVMNQTISDSADVDQRVTRLSLDYQINDSFKQSTLDVRAYLLYGDEKYGKQFEEDIKNTRALLEKRLNNCSAQARSGLEEALANVSEYEQDCLQILNLAREGKHAEAISTASTVAKYGIAINQLMAELIKENEQESGKVIQNMQNSADRGRSTTVLVSGVALLVGLFLALFITRMITRPILATVREAGRIADGDLSGEELVVRSRDEIARLAEAFNHMRANLREIVGNMTRTSRQVAESASQLASQAEQTA
ncbi:MAG: HAMP domain-containing protein, partial [Bacillota bacterium]|nr:HAMP domain-containing protein [Bacillota bacterium]